ncbi:RNA polymerase factor sigma-54 [Oceanobacillus manasiensis]|uniref:RNA polymerase factor sigma-54 n=1 Tax=Oceanobacillus manasiensis TaxID=586413 RepID=UPI0005AA16B7|nr:RNA polymerase factor sigma-54 [Oceanobacillus manasiensis]
MKTVFQLEQRLQRKLNQSLLQSIQLLQFSGLELLEYIEEIAEENPLIDQTEISTSFTDYIYDSSQKGLDPNLWEERERSMGDKLKDQLLLLDVPDEKVDLVEYGIDSLNDDGYLDITIEEWASEKLASDAQIQESLEILQQLEPAGVGARNLTECILLQVKRYSKGIAPFLEDLLLNHLDWIASASIAEISAEYNVTPTKVREILNQIKDCHPKPGQLLQPKKTENVVPEAFIYKSEGKWQVSFYKWSTPIITIDSTYQHINPHQKEAHHFLNRKRQEIEKLNRAFVFRANTLENIIYVIIQKQWQYFELGVHYIRALTLRDVAEDLNIHLSTVSRAVANKYVQTTNGAVPLKFFFQSGIKQKNGKQQASVSAKLLLKKIVEHEVSHSPYSDEALRDKLKKEFGIEIARRTVMKYREQLNIPSSIKRKEPK